MAEPIKTERTPGDIIGEGLANIYATGVNAVSGIGDVLGFDTSNLPDYTGESITNFWKGLAGDKSALETPVTTRGGQQTTLGNVAGMKELASSPVGAATQTIKEAIETAAPIVGGAVETIGKGVGDVASEVGKTVSETAGNLYEQLPEDVKTGISGLGKAAQLGAMGQIWNAVNAGAEHSVSHTANALEQLMSVDNKRSI